MTGTTTPADRNRSLTTLASGLRRALAVERVSVAEFGADGTFAVVADAGRPLLVPGTRVAISASTQIAETAAGHLYRAHDFTAGLDGLRAVDRLMLRLRFRSGCSLPLGDPARPLGALSISSAEPEFVTDGRLDLARDASVVLGELLVELLGETTEPAPARVLIHGDDEVLGRGVAAVLRERTALEVLVTSTLAEACAAAGAGAVDVLLAHGPTGPAALDRLRLALRLAGSDPAVALLDEGPRAAAPGLPRWRRRDGATDLVAMVDDLVGPAPSVRGGSPRAGTPALTPREGQILEGMARGRGTRRIAGDLGLTESTVKSYGRTLFRKLGAHSRGEAVANARAAGVTDHLGRPLP